MAAHGERSILINSNPTVYLIDDDLRVLKALRSLLQSYDYRVLSYDDPVQFLRDHDPLLPGCIVSDLAMPGLDGITLQKQLNALGGHQPLIFLTGQGSIPETVNAMKDGAVDFLTKPVDEILLLEAVRAAIERDDRFRKTPRLRLEVLTPREIQVLKHILAGRLNKQIASECDISERTIKFHRANLMKKLGLKSTAELIRLAARETSLSGRVQPSR